MKKPNIYILINGILTWPGGSKAWNTRGVTHLMWKHGVWAVSYAYLVGPLTRRIAMGTHVDHLRNLIAKLSGRFTVHLIAHSNGAEIVSRMCLQGFTSSAVATVHLIAPACRADMDKNGFNDALIEGRIGRLFIYRGTKDWAMKVARFSQVFRPINLGYGDLGNTRHAIPNTDNIKVMDYAGVGHSDLLKGDELAKTLQTVLAIGEPDHDHP